MFRVIRYTIIGLTFLFALLVGAKVGVEPRVSDPTSLVMLEQVVPRLPPDWGGVPALPRPRFEGTAVGVVDGGTFDLGLDDGTRPRIKLVGIEAIPLARDSMNRVKLRQPGLDAANQLRTLLGTELLKADVVVPIGRFRYLALVRAGDKQINREMARSGLSRLDRRDFPLLHEKQRKLLLQAEDEARVARRGLWAERAVAEPAVTQAGDRRSNPGAVPSR